MSSVWNFKKKFVSILMSVLLAFMMFPFAAFADTGQESSNEADASQNQATPEGEDASNSQGALEEDTAAGEQDVADSDASADMDVTDENLEVAQQDDADTILQDTDDVANQQVASQTLKNSNAKQSKSQNAPVEKSTPAKEIQASGAIDNMDWTLYVDGELVLSPHPGTDGKFVGEGEREGFWPWAGLTVTSVRCDGSIYASGFLKDMFYGQSELIKVDLTGLDTSEVTNMAGMFGECGNLTSIDLSDFNTSKVTNMEFMFGECYSLKTLDVSNFNTSKVTNMYCMFGNCETLTSLDLSNFDTSQVDNMSYMFKQCNSLVALDVSNFDTSKVTNMISMFSCYKLRSLDLSSFDMSNVKAFLWMFYGADSLTKIIFSDKFHYSSDMDLRPGSWVKGDFALSTDELVNLSSAELAGTWTYALDMKPAGTHGYTLWDFDGNQLFNTWYTTPEGKTYYFDKDGYSVRYLQEIDGKTYYFNGSDYTQFTGVLTWKKDGRISFFDAKRNGEMSKDRWISWKGKKYYLDKNGYSVKYRQYIDGDMYYFNSNGTQYTGVLTWKNNGSISFFDAKQKGKASTNRWISWKGKKYYLNDKGYSVRYLQTIKGNKYYFNKSYQMQTGVVIWKATGKLSYFDPRQAGKMSKNRWISYKGTKYYLDENGYSTKKVR